MKPVLCDGCCCAGGATRGYQRAGFYVVGIDNRQQPNYCGDKFYQDDILTYLEKNWHNADVFHVSPPCQRYSAMQHIKKNKEKYPDLIDPIRQLLISTGKPYVIENVVGAPLRIDLMLCGSFFGLGMIRHRIFESNVPMPLLTKTCNHANMYDPWHWGNNQRVEMAVGMGIDWPMTREEVREAIPPAYTEFIGHRIMDTL